VKIKPEGWITIETHVTVHGQHWGAGINLPPSEFGPEEELGGFAMRWVRAQQIVAANRDPTARLTWKKNGQPWTPPDLLLAHERAALRSRKNAPS
jgi:hypothetical protein